MAMADEPESLVLEHLLGLRASQHDLRREMQDGFPRVSQRIDRLRTEVRGLSYIVSTAVGAVLSDTEDLKARVAVLEERTEQPS